VYSDGILFFRKGSTYTCRTKGVSQKSLGSAEGLLVDSVHFSKWCNGSLCITSVQHCPEFRVLFRLHQDTRSINELQLSDIFNH
jgi:hypothetical protein